MIKQRLDQLLVARGMAESRSKAQALIMAGLVYCGEQKLDKAGAEFAEDIALEIRGREHPWVSRGGMKLAHALTHFKLSVQGSIALDIGASTGGFTDVLLTHGAAKVHAVDVGHGQLDAKLRNDPRVVVMENTNARFLTVEMFEPSKLRQSEATGAPLPPGKAASPKLQRKRAGEGVFSQMTSRPHPNSLSDAKVASLENPTSHDGRGEQASRSQSIFDVVVCDASFISLKKVLPAGLALAKEGALLIALIKPQFELGKAEVSRGKGVIRDAALHKAVCEDISGWIGTQGWRVQGITESPITGPKGNKEFLLVALKQ